jgi:hypothetical protein
MRLGDGCVSHAKWFRSAKIRITRAAQEVDERMRSRIFIELDYHITKGTFVQQMYKQNKRED